MRPEELRALLEDLQHGATTTEDALTRLRRLPVDDVGFARLDIHRELRQGIGEAIYSEGKTTTEVVEIAGRLLERTTGPVLATRASRETAEALVERYPGATHHARARLVVLRRETHTLAAPPVAVVSAGTSDLAVAEEGLHTAEALGAPVRQITDVGVAGLHRVLSVQDELHEAGVVIVVAGMEGALASIVGGLTSAPVVAVPTSVGYGASFGGVAALLTMLNSCAAGIAVSNIDNGFGAATFAVRVLRRLSQ